MPFTSGRSGRRMRGERAHALRVDDVQHRTLEVAAEGDDPFLAVEGQGRRTPRGRTTRSRPRGSARGGRDRGRRRWPSRRRASSCARWARGRGAAGCPSPPASALPGCRRTTESPARPDPGGIGSRPSGMTSTAPTSAAATTSTSERGPPRMAGPRGAAYGRDEEQQDDQQGPRVRRRGTAHRAAARGGPSRRFVARPESRDLASVAGGAQRLDSPGAEHAGDHEVDHDQDPVGDEVRPSAGPPRSAPAPW